MNPDQLADLSNLSVVIAIVLYVLALIGFTADLARTTQVRSDARLAARERVGARSGAAHVVTSGSGGTGTLTLERPTEGDGDGPGKAPAVAAPAQPGGLSARQFGVLMATLGVVLHLLGMVLRGVATSRVPWGNMYEFAMTGSAVVVVLFLLLSARRRELQELAVFVMGPALVLMFLAQTLWIVPAAQLTPSLQNSHWLVIHVLVAILSSALFTLGAVVAALQLAASRHEAALAAGRAAHWGRFGAVLDRLPGSRELEALSFRIHAIAFVGWTFTLIAGAIWANYAWGRPWNWDPKEVWTFVIWVVYAAYLHARATQGFRGNRAAWFALAGFACIIVNFTIVNTVINGMHSYSGLT
ncbi:c-type cytochrome biogenesis protein CcsB [Brachybacterium sp. EF45031]|uniref:c-type cytochrome biogenesis protein CcsB n=1 Tax=Brachybacterium sillae TaxID=2810536 RepID=UPI00217EB98F|nr:c-type cytochrome biogenesis protein CcsB [Brachybacterium sillae]MCS6711309.1 c-type cytochrome biogenesis protein CcsB [Brachybacterium sillae]